MLIYERSYRLELIIIVLNSALEAVPCATYASLLLAVWLDLVIQYSSPAIQSSDPIHNPVQQLETALSHISGSQTSVESILLCTLVDACIEHYS